MKISQGKIEHGTFTKENENKEENKSNGLNPKKIKILVAVVLGNFFLGSCYGILAPIFPPKAEEKNVSSTAYGFVFGIYQLTTFLSSPVYGKFITKLKPRFMMKTGMLLSGICNILFGLLDYAPGGSAFIGLALTIRFFDALGASAYLTASYTILGSELSDNIGRAMSLTETAYALGLAGGPVFGGFFFELGGFQMPFIAIGLVLFVGVVVNILLFSEDDCDVPQQTISALELLNDIDFVIDIIAIFTGFALSTFNELSLEPHIRQFSISPVTTGLVFVAWGLTDAVCSLIWGFFADKVQNAQHLTFLGSLILSAGFLIVGPASFLNFKTFLWIVIVSQVLLGVGESSFIVCSLTHGMKHTVEMGFPDVVGTYGVVSGVLFSAASFGAFIGPSLGGILIDEIGYINSTMAATGLGIIIAIICAGRLAYLFLKKKREA